jgi:N utilization substance protein B
VPERPLKWPISTVNLVKTSRRRRAREWVLRALYAREMTEGASDNFLTQLLEHDPPDDIDEPFASRLYDGVCLAGGKFDGEIEAHLENWDLNRLALIDLLLLRMALVEFERFPDVPPSVTLNEIIELAKLYSGGDSGGFVNGVLDAIIKRREDPGRTSGAGDTQGGSTA